MKDDENLLQTNLIDSLGSFRMIAFLEETFPRHGLKTPTWCRRTFKH